MNKVWRLIQYVIYITNILFVIAMIVSAYSSYFLPEKYAYISCLGIIFPFLLFANLLYFFFWLLVRRKYALLSFIACVACSVQIYTICPIHLFNFSVPKDAIKFLSYNAMGLSKKSKDCSYNPMTILNYINESKADIVCIQEYIPSKSPKGYQATKIDKILNNYPYHTYLKFRPKAPNGVACYSKYPILSSHVLPYKSRFNGGVIIDIKWGKDTLSVINNHLESNGITKEDRTIYKDIIVHQDADKLPVGGLKLLKKVAEATIVRGKQARIAQQVVDSLLRRNRSVIMCGDFNATPISYTLRTVSESLDNAFVRSGCGLGVSYNRGGFYFRIDHILYSKDLETYYCKVDNSIKESDHYPIWCYLKKKENR